MSTTLTPATTFPEAAAVKDAGKRLSEQQPLPRVLGKMRIEVNDDDLISDPSLYLKPSDDIRTELAKSINSMAEYRLPKTSRAGMIVEMMAHKLASYNGQLYPSWDIRMDFNWNKSGSVLDGHETIRAHDERWKNLIESDPSIFHDACQRALSPFVDDYIDILDMEGMLEASLDLVEPGRDTLVMTSFKGEDMGFHSRSAWTDHLKSLADDDLCDLWMSVRVLDSDLSRKARAGIMADTYNDIRHAMEADWNDYVEALPF